MFVGLLYLLRTPPTVATWTLHWLELLDHHCVHKFASFTIIHIPLFAASSHGLEQHVVQLIRNCAFASYRRYDFCKFLGSFLSLLLFHCEQDIQITRILCQTAQVRVPRPSTERNYQPLAFRSWHRQVSSGGRSKETLPSSPSKKCRTIRHDVEVYAHEYAMRFYGRS